MLNSLSDNVDRETCEFDSDTPYSKRSDESFRRISFFFKISLLLKIWKVTPEEKEVSSVTPGKLFLDTVVGCACQENSYELQTFSSAIPQMKR
jgi:hypothetical protein